MTVSLIPANIEYLGFAFQSDKDTAAAAPVICCSLEDCNLDPGVDIVREAESDRSAQQGEKAVVGAKPGGTFKKYLRPSEDDFFLYGLLGKTVDAGTTPKTHTITMDPAAPFTTPYMTVWDVWPGVATIRYDGVRVGQAVITGQPGGLIEVEYTLVALKATLGVTEPSSVSALFVSELAHSWPELTATVGSLPAGIVNQFQLTIDRNTNRFEGDNGFTALDCPNGLVAVTGNLEVAFLDDDLLRAANTGTTSGTALTTTIYDLALALDFVRGSNYETKFSLANAQLTNYKVNLKTDASPAVATFDFDSKRQSTLSNLITVLSHNLATHADRS